VVWNQYRSVPATVPTKRKLELLPPIGSYLILGAAAKPTFSVVTTTSKCAISSSGIGKLPDGSQTRIKVLAQ